MKRNGHPFARAAAARAIGLFFASLFLFARPTQARADSVVAIVADAQGLPLVPRDQLPFSGTFWEVRNSIPCIFAPLPCPPLDPAFPIYQICDGEYLVDETGGAFQTSRYSSFNGADASSILQEQATELLNQIGRIQGTHVLTTARSFAMEGPDTSPSGGFDPAYTPTTNDLWLQITGMTNTTGTFVIHPPSSVATGVYDLFGATNLLAPWWEKLLRCAPGQTNLVLTNLTSSQEFFILGLTNDADGGGMSDAWEGLLGLHANNAADDHPTPLVGISVIDSVAMKDDPSNTASFQITRLGGHMTWPLTLPLQLSGSATIYINYTLTPATVTASNVLVTIPVGQTNVVLTLTAMDDRISGDTTTATLTLQSGSGWDIDPARASATALIEDTYSAVPCAWWNVTDISSPSQPVNIGELQEPFAAPVYVPGTGHFVPPMTNPWHTTAAAVTEACGTTASGGTGHGTVFRIDPAGPPQGMFPNELVQVSDKLYGTTEGLDGTYFGGYGTIFCINTNGSGFTTLYTFGGSDGSHPQAGLVVSGGMLYGTTSSGGVHGYGNVFRFNVTNNAVTILHDFGLGSTDGAAPSANLLLAGGVLFGTTSSGGSANKGTVFEINTDGTSYQILHSFSGGSDGKEPGADLLFSGGDLYGTTPRGGTHDLGTLFSVNTNGSSFTTLHQFSGTDGGPQAGLVISGSTLYGTTEFGGANGDGTVFSVNTSGSNYAILHSFNESSTNNGASPVARLTLGGGTLYGTTHFGGAFDDGVVFSVNTNGTSYTNLYSFKNGLDGQLPDTALVLSGNALYGTTPGDLGPPNYGTIFSIHTDGGGFQVLSTFSTFAVIHTFSGSDGAQPSSQLALSGSDFYGIPTTVYGTTSGGGSHGYGTVFRVNTDGTGFTNLYQFTGGSDGASPQAGLLIDGNTLYGTTTNSIFKINTDGGSFTLLTNISAASQLVLSLSGRTLYGTTSNGGSFHFGSVFSIKTDGSGLTNIHEFPGGAGGAYPGAGLELYGAGAFLSTGVTNFVLYGTTYSGGANADGLVFSVNIDGSEFTDLHDFNGTNDGAHPLSGLLLTNNNFVGTYLFGTTSTGGTNGGGTVFSMYGSGATFRTLCSLGGPSGAGANPGGSLAYAGGKLYGTARTGGAYTNGMVFGVADDGSGFIDLHDFGGIDGASPLAGLAFAIADNPESIWSLDSAIYVSAENVTNLSYSIAMDNYFILYVNGNYVNTTNHVGPAEWSPYLPLPFLHAGENDLRLIIGADNDSLDYFAMALKSAFTNVVYGTTYNGGSNAYGSVFRVSPAGYEILYNFSNAPDGQNPIGDVVLSGDKLYGMTVNGGTYGYGTVFSIGTNGAGYATLHSFANTPDGAYPNAGLAVSDNTLYGTTEDGGDAGSDGTVFRINKDGSGYTTLYRFAGSSDGQNPRAPIVMSSNALYGTTYYGGASHVGTIFSIGTNGSGYTTLYSFNGSAGSSPRGRLIASSGTLYGVTENGGTNGYGTVFSIGVDGMSYQMLHSFANQPDGASPLAGLALAGNTLYGTTFYGGTNSLGTIFSINSDGSGYTNLLSFGSLDSSYGAHPRSDLLILGDSLLGTAFQGGAVDAGIVFGMKTNGIGFYNIYDFRDTPDGAKPEGGLTSP